MKQPLKMAKFTTEVYRNNQDLYDLFLETLFWINLCLSEKLIQTANIWLSIVH